MAPEEKNSEEKQNLAKLLADLGQLNPNPLLEVDFSGKVTFCNEAAVKILKEMGLQEPNSFVPKDLEYIANAVREGQETWFYREVRLENRVFGEDLHGDMSFQAVRIYGVDITMLKKAEESRLLLAAIVESSDDAIISKTLDGEITSWNRGAERLYGYAAQEALGRSIDILVPPGRRNEVPEILQKISLGESIDHYETVRQRKDGQKIHVSLTISPIKDAEERITGASTIARDITERKRAEEELRRRTAQLQTANEEMESFSYSVAHDLKTPVRTVQGFTRMLMGEHAAQLDAEGIRLLNVITSSAKIMHQIIDDLLALSRLGRMQIRKSVINLSAMADKVFERLQVMEPERDLLLTIGDLPPGLGDQSLIYQVLENLLSNAIKYTRARKAAVIEVGGKKAETETIYYVKDNGAGFDERYASNLFRPFQRLHTCAEFEGTGIGLATVKRIIERHGGRVWAEGKVDKGATFYFSLPKNGA